MTCSHPSTDTQSNRCLDFPTDSSPYDVRNLAGNVAELTRTDELGPGEDPAKAKTENLDYRVKGGSGFDDLEPFFHMGGHTRERKRDSSHRIGFRLAAYPGPPGPGEHSRD